MTTPKQDERPKTLIEYMGFKDPDLKDFSHDEWCLKLLNEKLLKKILKNKIINKLKKQEKRILYEHIVDGVSFYDTSSISGLGNPKGKLIGEFEIIKEFFEDSKIIELEHVITKYGRNGFSQRMGFIDVYFKIDFIEKESFFYKEVKQEINSIKNKFILFFEVKTSKQTIGAIAREIEYYRDVLWEAEGHRRIIPFLVAKEKLPITQFETITFDEILQLEKEIEQEQ